MERYHIPHQTENISVSLRYNGHHVFCLSHTLNYNYVEQIHVLQTFVKNKNTKN